MKKVKHIIDDICVVYTVPSAIDNSSLRITLKSVHGQVNPKLYKFTDN